MTEEEIEKIKIVKIKQKEKFLFLQLSNFVDWFAPSKEVNEKLHNNLVYLVAQLEKYEMNKQEANTDGKEESDTEN